MIYFTNNCYLLGQNYICIVYIMGRGPKYLNKIFECMYTQYECVYVFMLPVLFKRNYTRLFAGLNNMI